MSSARDRLNAAGLLKLLGRAAPPREAPQPLAVAAAGAGGGGGGDVNVDIVVGSVLTAGKVYFLSGSGWTLLDTSVGLECLVGWCVSVGASSSVLRISGVVDSTAGGEGSVVYVAASGTPSSTFTGDEESESTSAPWVWEIGRQISTTQAVILPASPFRPRQVRLCIGGGATALTVVLREYPPDP